MVLAMEELSNNSFVKFNIIFRLFGWSYPVALNSPVLTASVVWSENLHVAMASGAVMLNIIPDRNYTPGKRDKKLDNLYAVVALAQKLNLPVIVGTELNVSLQPAFERPVHQEFLDLKDISP